VAKLYYCLDSQSVKAECQLFVTYFIEATNLWLDVGPVTPGRSCDGWRHRTVALAILLVVVVARRPRRPVVPITLLLPWDNNYRRNIVSKISSLSFLMKLVLFDPTNTIFTIFNKPASKIAYVSAFTWHL